MPERWGQIFKKEKRYAYSIEMYMLSYLHKNHWNHIFQYDMFLKDIKLPANKLNLNNIQRDYLARLVETAVKAAVCDESSLGDQYRRIAKG